MEKLWGGRFKGDSKEWVDTFGASISFDQKLALEDLTGSLAHVKMLKETEILTVKEADEIIKGLNILLEKSKANQLTFSIQNEDIHLNLEALLHEEIGPVAGKLHTARSRNDQVATDIHLYLKNHVEKIVIEITHFQEVLIEKAQSNIETLLPGYTHLQHAQPISFAHHLLAYVQMLQRDKERLIDNLKRIDISPLGAAALAGTTFPIDRHFTAEKLGFSQIYENSLDAVSDRDFVIEFLSNSSILMMHLSRFCEEIILWCSHEFQFVELSDTFSTGSSIMPQKKNPDMAELIRGKTGRVYGHLMGLLTTMKGLPLAYNKDLQEDKEGMFDTVETLEKALPIMAGMVETMTVKKEVMYQSTTKDFSNATELADYLAKKGMPFRQAHGVVGNLVFECIQKGIYLNDVSLKEYQMICPFIENDIYEILKPEHGVKTRHSFGGTGFEQVKVQLEKAQSFLEMT